MVNYVEKVKVDSAGAADVFAFESVQPHVNYMANAMANSAAVRMMVH